MSSITIHRIDDDLDKRIRSESANEKLSINKFLKKVIAGYFGYGDKPAHKKEFADLFGTWSKKDVEEFKNSTKDFEKIDPEDWK